MWKELSFTGTRWRRSWHILKPHFQSLFGFLMLFTSTTFKFADDVLDLVVVLILELLKTFKIEPALTKLKPTLKVVQLEGSCRLHELPEGTFEKSKKEFYIVYQMKPEKRFRLLKVVKLAEPVVYSNWRWAGQILRKRCALCITWKNIKIRFRLLKVVNLKESCRLPELSEGGLDKF